MKRELTMAQNQKPNLGHQRAYLRNTLRYISAEVSDMVSATSVDKVHLVEKRIRSRISAALEYTRELPDTAKRVK